MVAAAATAVGPHRDGADTKLRNLTFWMISLFLNFFIRFRMFWDVLKVLHIGFDLALNLVFDLGFDSGFRFLKTTSSAF